MSISFYRLNVDIIYILRIYVFQLACEIIMGVVSILLFLEDNAFWIINIFLWFFLAGKTLKTIRDCISLKFNFNTVLSTNPAGIVDIVATKLTKKEINSLIDTMESKKMEVLDILRKQEDDAALLDDKDTVKRTQSIRDDFNEIYKSMINKLKTQKQNKE